MRGNSSSLDTNYVQRTRGLEFMGSIVHIRNHDAADLSPRKPVLGTSVGELRIEGGGALVIGVVGAGRLSPLVLWALGEKTRVDAGMVQHEWE